MRRMLCRTLGLLIALMVLTGNAGAWQDPATVTRVLHEPPLHPRVTLSFSRTPILAALRQLNAAADGSVKVDYRQVRAIPGTVTASFNNRFFEDVLRWLLEQTHRKLSYTLDDRTFVVREGGVMPKLLALPARSAEETDDLAFALENARPVPVVQAGHTAAVHWVGFSPDGKVLASGGAEGVVYLWDMNGRRQLRTLIGATGATGFVERGKYLLTGVGSQLIQWRIATGHAYRRNRKALGGVVLSAATTAGGGAVMSANDGSVRYFHGFGVAPRVVIAPGKYNYRVGSSLDGALLSAFKQDTLAAETDEEKMDADRFRRVELFETATGRPVPMPTLSGPPQTRLRSVAISPDRTRVILGRDDGKAEVYSRTAQAFLATIGSGYGAVQIAFSPDGAFVALASGRQVEVWNTASWRAPLAILPVPAATSVAFQPQGAYLAVGRADGEVMVWDWRARRQIVAFPPGSERIDLATLSPDASTMMTFGGGRSRLWDLGMVRLPRRPDTPATGILSRSPDGVQVVGWQRTGLIVYATTTGRAIRSLALPPDLKGPPERLSYSADSQRIVGAGWKGQVVVWDAQSGEVAMGPLREPRAAGEAGRKELNFAQLSGDGRFLVTRDSEGHTVVWDALQGSVLHRIDGKPKPKEVPPADVPPPDSEEPSPPTESEEEPLWDQFPERSSGAMAVSQHRSGAQTLAVTEQTITYLYSLETGNKRAVLGGFTPVFDPRGRFVFVTSGNNLLAYDLASPQNPKTLTECGDRVTFSADGSLLAGANPVSQTSRPVISVIDLSRLTRIAKLTGHVVPVTAMAFSKDTRRLLSASQDGVARLWDLSPHTREQINEDRCQATFIGLGSADAPDYVVVTPDNRYMASRGALRRVGFRFEDVTLSFDQFDLLLNRPDIVLSRLGRAPKPLIDSLQTAYRMRVQKMGLKGDPGGSATLHLPTVDVEPELPTEVVQPELTLTVTGDDAAEDLAAVLVYVNDVPALGRFGRDISGRQAHRVTESVAIHLTPGLNKIQVSVRNAVGAESLRLTRYVVRQAPPPTPRLFVLAVGISKYRNTNYNLEAADTDARALVAFFESLSARRPAPTHRPAPRKAPTPARGRPAVRRPPTPPRTPPATSTVGREGLAPLYGTRYAEVFTRLLSNEQATRENILQAAAFLREAREEDHVILFFAGHGTIDTDLTYYFATYEVDMAHLKDTALPYEELENLLDPVRARQRLVLLDTCQSGEIYIDPAALEREVTAVSKIPERAQAARNLGSLKRGLPGASLTEDDAASLTREMFSDLRRGTGAQVIAAASGIGSALERDGNGVFTGALLTVLRDLQRRGAALSVAALRDQVAAEVARRTQGDQQPVSRAEALEFDFPLLLQTGPP
jgi:WD40 repeat protein